MTLRRTPSDPRSRYLFPAWECLVPSLGIFYSQGGNKCLSPLLNKQLLLKNKGTLLNHKWHLFDKATHLSHQTARSPLYKGLPLISSLPWSLPPTLPFLSRLVSQPLRAISGLTGGVTGEIWERSEISLPYSNPFVQRPFQRFRERWEIFVCVSP